MHLFHFSPFRVVSKRQTTPTMVNKDRQPAKDIGSQVWLSPLRLLSFHEYIFTVDHSSLWRQHLAWAKENGADLRNHLTQRFASSMVFMSLILSSQLMVLFNSNHLTTTMRTRMMAGQYDDYLYWVGVVITVSVFLTFFTLISNFTAWGMVSAISDNNAHCLLRSSIGLYVTQLPSRLVTLSIYCFLLWITMFTIYILPGPYIKIMFALLGIFFIHIVSVFSAFGRLILHTGGMGSQRIFEQEFEDFLLPSGLHVSLLIMALEQVNKATSVPGQYYDKLSSQSEIEDWEEEDEPKVMQREQPLEQPLERPLEQPLALGDSLTSIGSDYIRQHFQNNGFVADPSPQVSPTQNRNRRRRQAGARFPTESVLGINHHAMRTVTRPFKKIRSNRSISFKDEDVEEAPDRSSFMRRAMNRRTHRRASLEYQNEKHARTMYQIPTPPPPLEEDLTPIRKQPLEEDLTPIRKQSRRNLPSPSILNKANLTFNSIKRVTKSQNTMSFDGFQDEPSDRLSHIVEANSFEHFSDEEKPLMKDGKNEYGNT
uniref:Uncharacterized protein n=1 Tax=Ditylum brightwellii TaxID=49249 RepID=A0A7S4UN13_9STRA